MPDKEAAPGCAKLVQRGLGAAAVLPGTAVRHGDAGECPCGVRPFLYVGPGCCEGGGSRGGGLESVGACRSSPVPGGKRRGTMLLVGGLGLGEEGECECTSAGISFLCTGSLYLTLVPSAP